MSAASALAAARAIGLELVAEGDDLILEADSIPPIAVLGRLRRHKAQIASLLRLGSSGWSADDWRALFDERAAIFEFDCGLPRDLAEAYAIDACIQEWMDRSFCQSPK